MGGIAGNCGAQAHQPPARAYKFLVKKASRSAGAAPWSPLQAPVRQVCWSEEREEGQGDWAAAGDAWSAPWDGGAVPCRVTYDAEQDQAWHDWTDAGRADAGAPRPSKGKWPGRKESGKAKAFASSGDGADGTDAWTLDRKLWQATSALGFVSSASALSDELDVFAGVAWCDGCESRGGM